MRVVLDANVLVSAAISSRGIPGEILNLWEQERFDLVMSPPILEELERVIHYPRIQQKYQLPEESIARFLDLISSQSILVNPTHRRNVVASDPADNRYLECAIEGNAASIVSGDKHLLELKEYLGIVILHPAAFIALLSLEEQNQGG